jgi:polyphenol oxidase
MHLASGTFPSLRRAAWFITGRHGGFSSAPFTSLNLADHVGDDPRRVARNRMALSEHIGADETVWMQAVHGSTVREVPDLNDAPESDVLITRTPGLAIATLAADCVSVAMADAHGIIGVAHVGWRGLVAGTISNAVDTMVANGATHIDVVIGPAICGACYPVPIERVQHVSEVLPAEVCDQAIRDATHLDVQAGVIAQLAAHPCVGEPQIIPGCTMEDERLFSYRRDQQTGRHAMVAVMRDG